MANPKTLRERAYRDDIIEACAKIADSYGSLNGRDKANDIADEIRAMKGD
jgi:hypothetical protein